MAVELSTFWEGVSVRFPPCNTRRCYQFTVVRQPVGSSESWFRHVTARTISLPQRQDAIYSDATSHQKRYCPHWFGLSGPLAGQADQLGKCWVNLQPQRFGLSDPSGESTVYNLPYYHCLETLLCFPPCCCCIQARGRNDIN